MKQEQCWRKRWLWTREREGLQTDQEIETEHYILKIQDPSIQSGKLNYSLLLE